MTVNCLLYSLFTVFFNYLPGYGVIATKNTEAGEFLLEYVGRHISGSDRETLF